MLNHIETILVRGGIMMIPLLVCSFLVILITLERLFILRRKRQVPDGAYLEWQHWFDGRNESGETSLPMTWTLIGRILEKTVELLPLSRNRLEERLGDLARFEKHRLERGLVILDTIAGIAPLFGLLGTALGMVDVFSRLSLMDEAKMTALSSGISQALFTTVAGLIIGIPALIAYNIFSRQIKSLMITAEDQLNRLVDAYFSDIIDEK